MLADRKTISNDPMSKDTRTKRGEKEQKRKQRFSSSWAGKRMKKLIKSTEKEVGGSKKHSQ